MKTLKLKYLKTLQDSYKKGLITKKEWKTERKSIRRSEKSNLRHDLIINK